MSRSMTLRILFLLTPFLLSAALDVQEEGDPTPRQTCFDFTGRPLTNNTQCPGSNACCNFLHQCTDNLLCTQDDSEDFVNALCAENPWSDCSNICQYGTDLNGYLPRVTQCSDGTFCCDSDFDCCEKKQGITLDGRGNIVSNTTSSETSTSATSSSSSLAPASSTVLFTTGGASMTGQSSSPTAAPATPSSTPTPDQDPDSEADTSSVTPSSSPSSSDSSSGLSVGVKAGIGVSVSFSVLSFIVLLALFILKRRQKKNKRSSQNVEAQLPRPVPPYELHDNTLPHELPAEVPEKSEFDDSSIESCR